MDFRPTLSTKRGALLSSAGIASCCYHLAGDHRELFELAAFACRPSRSGPDMLQICCESAPVLRHNQTYQGGEQFQCGEEVVEDALG